jgi:hypothetical protein
VPPPFIGLAGETSLRIESGNGVGLGGRSALFSKIPSVFSLFFSAFFRKIFSNMPLTERFQEMDSELSQDNTT